MRLAVYHTGLGRDGPGLLLRDIRRSAADVLRVRDALVALNPDAVLLLDFDHDRDLLALRAFQRMLADAGLALPQTFAPRPNAGIATGLDLDGDGRRGEADDAQGWGRFSGAGGMALLSRWPVAAATDHSAFLWRDLPGARLPRVNGEAYPSAAVFDVQRLSSTGHWEVTLDTPAGPLTLLAWHAGPPVFGGPHERNRRRNADETAFWRWRLDTAPPATPFVLLGDANLDPDAGAGERAEMAALLSHPLLRDPAPEAPLPSGGPPTRATASWPDGPGALRVDYLLPSRALRVLSTGLQWPSPEAVHAIVWADLALDR
ncbi:MAG: endonuclease/exonuclease/phosphatase family protein [Rhodobacteraceae bacterium]|nr:endonuclease/exonuclease/phosphatase family protein [Paracoccaceae bacterium]